MPEPILEVKNLSYATPNGSVLASHIDFQLNRGDLIAVSGENGSGKTSLIHTLLGFRQPRNGEINCSIPKTAIAYLPQVQDNDFHIPVSISDVIQMAFSKSVSSDQITNIGLLQERHFSLKWNTASGGEKRRALLTRLILKKPVMLILDEPFNHLDVESKEAILRLLKQFIAEKTMGIILVSHDPLVKDHFPDLVEVNIGDK